MKRILFFLTCISFCTYALSQHNLYFLHDYNGGSVANISSDGKLVLGNKAANNIGEAFLWKVETQTAEAISGISEVYQVSNNGIVVGNFEDGMDIYEETVYSGGYYKNGEWHRVNPIPGFVIESHEHTSKIRGVSVDGNILGGYAHKISASDIVQVPTVWKNSNFEKNFIESSGTILCVSADGSLFGGSLRSENLQTLPVIFSENSIDTIKINGELKNGEVKFISSNNRYAAVRIDAQAAIYEIPTKTLTVVGKHDGSMQSYATSVSDNGILLGYSIWWMGSNPNQAFIYSPQFGFKDLDIYARKTLTDIDLSDLIGFRQAISISADGNSIVGLAQTKISSLVPWVLVLDPSLMSSCERPTNVTVNVVENTRVNITWNVPASNTENSGMTVEGYNIYRNDEKINTSLITNLNFTDENPNAGYPKYSVSALWSNLCESSGSDPIEAMVVDNYNIPFIEVFETPEYRTNFWTLENGENSHWIKNHNPYEGLLPYCIYYQSQQNEEYSDALVSKKLDATHINDLELSYTISATSSNDVKDKMSVEVFDGNTWHTVKTYDKNDNVGNWKFEKVDIAAISEGKIINIRFRAHSTGNNIIGYWYLDNIKVYSKAEEIIYNEAYNIFAAKAESDNTFIRWTAPSGTATLSYLNSTWVSPTVGNEGATFIAANSFTKDEIAGYADHKFDEIKFYSHQQSEIYPAQYKLVIFENNELVYDEILSDVVKGWNLKKLKTNYIINPEKSFKFGLEMIHEVDDAPIAIDQYGPVRAGKGNLYSEDNGKTWQQLPASFNGNWAMIALLKKADVTAEDSPTLIGYNIYRDNNLLNTQYDNGGLSYFYDDNTNKANHCYNVEIVYDQGYISKKSNDACSPTLCTLTWDKSIGTWENNNTCKLLYNSEAQGISALTTPESLQGDIKYEYIGIEGTNYEATDQQPSDIGNYSVKAYINAAGYNSAEITAKLIIWDGLDVEGINQNNLSVYPNPANDVVNIKGEFTEVSLINSLGNLIFTTKNKTIDLSTIPAGMYILKIDSVNGSVNKKLYVKK